MAWTPEEYARHRIEHGREFPYDGIWEATGPDPELTPVPSADDPHFVAARGVLADLCDRRGIKWELSKVDHETREEIIATLAGIIRMAVTAS